MAEQAVSQITRRQYIQTGTAIASAALAGCSANIAPTQARSQRPQGSFLLRMTIRALSAVDGSKQWTITLDGLAGLIPRLGAGLIYVSRDQAGVTAVDISDGTVKWSLDVPPAEIMEADGTLYAFTEDTVYAINTTNGTIQWTTELPAIDAGNSSSASEQSWTRLALARGGTPRGNIYVGTKRDNGGTIHAFDITDGTEQWRLFVPSYLETRKLPAGPQLSIHGKTLYTRGPTKLTAVDLRSKTIRWTATLASEQKATSTQSPSIRSLSEVTAPAVSPNRIYTAILSTNGSVVALDRQTGVEQWRTSGRIEPESAPRLVNGHVVVRGKQHLRSLSHTDGSPDWSFRRGVLYHRPAVQDATVYLATPDQSIFNPLGDMLGFQPDRGHVYAVNARTGEMKWRTLISDPGIDHLTHHEASDSLYTVYLEPIS